MTHDPTRPLALVDALDRTLAARRPATTDRPTPIYLPSVRQETNAMAATSHQASNRNDTGNLRLLTLPVSRRSALRSIGGGGLTAAFLLAAAPRLANAGPEHAHPVPMESNYPITLTGVWDLAFTRLDSDTESESARVLATFTEEGGVQVALVPVWIAGDGLQRFHSAGHGTWVPGDSGHVVARYTVMNYDQFGAYGGSRHVTATVKLDAEASTLNGAYEGRTFDSVGSLVDYESGTVAGKPAQFRASIQSDTPIVSDPNNLPPQPNRRGEPY